jgi:c-di-GMP-binding flagellar brake protein YcgR
VSQLLSFLIRLTDYWVSETLYHLLPRAQRWKDIQSGWADSSGEAANIVAWTVGVLLVGLLIFAIINTRKEAAKNRERERVYFERKAVEKELDKKHIKLLSDAIRVTEISHPYKVLDSFDVFQHLVEDYHKRVEFTEHEHSYFHQMVDEIKGVLGFNRIEEAVQLQSTEEIRKGQEVKITLKKGDQTYEYPSKVEDNSDKQIVLDASKLDLDFMPITVQTPITINFFRESDAGYDFTTTLIKPPVAEEKLIYLKHPGKLNRVQARNFSRMEVFFKFSFFHLPKDKFNPIEIDQNLEYCNILPVFTASTVDISGGGIAFNARKQVGKGDHLYLNFQMLSDEHREPVLSEVVWTGKAKEKGMNLVRAKFGHITDTTQETLMKFIYQIQRKAARRMKFAPKK